MNDFMVSATVSPALAPICASAPYAF